MTLRTFAWRSGRERHSRAKPGCLAWSRAKRDHVGVILGLAALAQAGSRIRAISLGLAKALAHEDAVVAGLAAASRLFNRLRRRGADSRPSFHACRAGFRDSRVAMPRPPRTRAAGGQIPSPGAWGKRRCCRGADNSAQVGAR